MIKLQVTVETHLDESTICALSNHAQNILYLTIKCGSDVYADGGVV